MYSIKSASRPRGLIVIAAGSLAVAGLAAGVLWPAYWWLAPLGVALFLLAPLVPSRGTGEPRGRRWSLDDIKARRVIWVVVAASLVPAFVQAFSAPRKSNVVAYATGASSAAAAASYALLAGLLLLCVATVIGSIKQRVATPPVGLLALLMIPWLVTVASSIATGSQPPINAAVWLAVAVALWATSAHVAHAEVTAWTTWVVAAAALAMGVLAPAYGLLHGASGHVANADKAIIGTTLLTGPFTHSNGLGTALALGLPGILLLPSRWQRIGMFGTVVAALIWSGSRSGLVAAAVSMLAVVLVRRFGPAGRRAVSRLLLLAAGAAVVVAPLATADPAVFSSRGRIWMGSLAAAGESLLFGNGYGWYGVIGQFRNNLIPEAYHGHNLFVHLLAVGGITLVVAVAVLLLRVGRAAVRLAGEGQLYPFAFVIAFLAVGILEVATRFRDLDPLFYVAAVPLLLLALTRSTPVPRSERPRDKEDHAAAQVSAPSR